MEYKCLNCASTLKEFTKTEEDKLEIWAYKAGGFQLFGVKLLREQHRLSLKEAKAVMLHMNLVFGKCHRCDYDELESENIICPKCQSFNYNWKINQSFSKEFCDILEYKLCDLMFIRTISKEKISEHREIITTISTGKSGQEKYKIIIELGEQALKNYISGESIINCIPVEYHAKNFSIDLEPKTVWLLLD